MVRFKVRNQRIRTACLRIALILWFVTDSEMRGCDLEVYRFADDPDRFLCQMTSYAERNYNICHSCDSDLSFTERCRSFLCFLAEKKAIHNLSYGSDHAFSH